MGRDARAVDNMACLRDQTQQIQNVLSQSSLVVVVNMEYARSAPFPGAEV